MATEEATQPPTMLPTRLTRSATGKLPLGTRSATSLTSIATGSKKVTATKDSNPEKKATKTTRTTKSKSTLSSTFKVGKPTPTSKDTKNTITSALKDLKKDNPKVKEPTTAKPKQLSTFISPPLPAGPAPPAPPLLYLNADEITSNLEKGKAHLLQTDPQLQTLFTKNPDLFKIYTPQALTKPLNPFASLASGIISQQVSSAAARSIKRNFLSLFPPTSFPTPHAVLSTPLPTLRTAGLSTRKAEYLHSLSHHFLTSPHLLSSTFFLTATNTDIVSELVQIRGVGEWSVQMFLIFELRRWDVFSLGDLGVQRGCALYKKEREREGKGGGKEGKGGRSELKGGKGKWKFMTEGEMKAVGEVFAPWRSLWCLCAWRISDTGVESLVG